MKVLIVEDGPSRAEALGLLYQFQETVVCHSAEDAILALRAVSFDLVHLDFDLEGSEKGDVVASHIAEHGVKCIVVVHSENPDGIRQIRAAVATSLTIPVSFFLSKSPVVARLKAMLSKPLTKIEIPALLKLLDESYDAIAPISEQQAKRRP